MRAKKLIPVMPTTSNAMSSGKIELSININLDMQEISMWAPDRISAFFTGLTQLMVAKGAVDDLRKVEREYIPSSFGPAVKEEEGEGRRKLNSLLPGNSKR